MRGVSIGNGSQEGGWKVGEERVGLFGGRNAEAELQGGYHDAELTSEWSSESRCEPADAAPFGKP